MTSSATAPAYTAPLVREVVGIVATDLQPGDLVLLPGCQCRSIPLDGCEHRDYAAFDVALPSPLGRERVVVWPALGDREDRGHGETVLLVPGARLLVGRRLPTVDPADALAVSDTLPAEEPSCGPAGNLDRGGDLNSTWTCPQARWAYWRLQEREQVLAEVERIAVLDRGVELAAVSGFGELAERKARRASNLRTWVLGAIVRVDARAGLHPCPPCEHDEQDRRVLSVAESLPDCTC